MMNILKDKEKDFKITIFLIIAIFLFFGFSIFSMAFAYENILAFPIFFAFIFLFTAIGLFYKKRAALNSAQFIIFIFLLTAVVGYINPFTASDMMAQGKTPPPIWLMVLQISPFVVFFVWCLHILDKYKSKFGKSDANSTKST